MRNSQQIRLSASSLNLFLECPKCFWAYKAKGVKKPEQSFALQNNFDRILKPYFDKFRAKGELPPELVGQVEGKLMPDQGLIDRWRDAMRPVLAYQDKEQSDFVLVGALDDCLFDGEYYIPVDFKTTGSAAFEENAKKYYQHQLNIYNFLLEQGGYKTKGIAYLVYYKPDNVADKGIINFQVGVKKMETSHEMALKLFQDGIKTLLGPIPKSSPFCQYCSWSSDFVELK
ncbi:MAG: PD-(D/E)XK nuclease family protein [Candidatus Nealsonbacteria bacterium]|nr:PD-(D/E)XK nuclease family protein [Candidatus Nealsonbacteria bacterium]